MQSEDFQRWLSQIKHLTEHPQRQVVDTLTQQAERTVLAGLLEPVSQCPHCASPSIGHWGNRRVYHIIVARPAERRSMR